MNEIAQNKIKIYDFPEPLEDEEEAKVLRQLRTRVPFAVVGANTIIEVEGGKKVRGRRYPWGVAEGITSRPILFMITPLQLLFLPFISPFSLQNLIAQDILYFECFGSNFQSFFS